MYAKALPTANQKWKYTNDTYEQNMWGPPLGHGGMELRSTPPKAPKTINSNTSYLHLFIPQKKEKKKMLTGISMEN